MSRGYAPGAACSTRDLVEDLYASLHKRNIPLMLYWTGDGPRGDRQAANAFDCQFPVTPEFVQRWADVAAEYGRRYGDKVAGWWVDGCYPWIGHELLTGTSRPAVPPGNLAYRKQAQLLSLDGSHELAVNAGVHSPRLGVDSHTETVALAGGQWPWSYQVDLVDTREVGRIKVTFGSGYATDLEICVSTDGIQWKVVAQAHNLTGTPFERIFSPVLTRYVRVRGLKPDGPEQSGIQMSIAELEVYESSGVNPEMSDTEDWKALESKSVELPKKLRVGVCAVNASETAFSPLFSQWKVVRLDQKPDSGS